MSAYVAVEQVAAGGILVETRDDEAGGYLPAYLVLQGVAELDGFAILDSAPDLLCGQVAQVGERNAVAHDEAAVVVPLLYVEYVEEGVHEPGEERPAALEDAEAFAPDWEDVVNEAVGDRVEDEIEGFIAKRERSRMSPSSRRMARPSRSATS